jgi:hypothetical protein
MSFLSSKASLVLAPWPAQERRQSRRVYVFPAFQAVVAPAGGEKRKTNFGDVLADRL